MTGEEVGRSAHSFQTASGLSGSAPEFVPGRTIDPAYYGVDHPQVVDSVRPAGGYNQHYGGGGGSVPTYQRQQLYYPPPAGQYHQTAPARQTFQQQFGPPQMRTPSDLQQRCGGDPPHHVQQQRPQQETNSQPVLQSPKPNVPSDIEGTISSQPVVCAAPPSSSKRVDQLVTAATTASTTTAAAVVSKPTQTATEEPLKSAPGVGQEDWERDFDQEPATQPSQKTHAGSKIASPSLAPSDEASKSSSLPAASNTATLPSTTKKVNPSNLPKLDSRPHMNIVFIGHVDAGKSTTCGNILYLTEQVDKRTIEKYEREAKEKNRDTWFFAFIMDINDEERAKGKTVEVGRALFDTPNKRFTILDAPGHKSFVPNMISGAAQADVGVLIISARKGEFETGFERGGQTREHAMLARTLGVNQLIVAVNKMDDPTCNWSQERFNDIQKKLTPFLRSCGYNPAKDIYFIPISGLTGQNIKYKVGDPKSACYVPNGAWFAPTNLAFLELLDTLMPPERSSSSALRMPLLEGYRDQGVVAPGKVEAGSVAVNDMAIIMPNRMKVKIIGVSVNDTDVAEAGPGENVTLRVTGVEEDMIGKGAVLSSVDSPCVAGSLLKCQVIIVELLEHRPILTAGYNCVFHVHTLSEEAQFVALLEGTDKATKKKKLNPKFVKENSIVVATIRLSTACCVEKFSDCPQLGRFTLRDEGRTIAVGKVLEILE